MEKATIKEINEFYKKNYYNLGSIQNIKILDPNNINSDNYLITTKKIKYVLRKSLDNSNPKKLLQTCKILDFLTKNKVKVPKPIKNKKNNFFEKKELVYLTKYYEGRFFQGNIKEVKDIAKNLAQLHLSLEKNKISYNFQPYGKYFKILTDNEFRKIIKIIKKRSAKDTFDKKVSKNIDYLIEQSKIDCENTKFIKNLHLKSQLIHGDLHPKNVIFSKNKVGVILDFNTMKRGFKNEDVVFASFRFASQYTNDIKKILTSMQIFLKSYMSYNHLEESELNYSNYFLKNIILSRISFLLKKRYFENWNLWDKDFNKHFNSLKIADKVKISII